MNFSSGSKKNYCCSRGTVPAAPDSSKRKGDRKAQRYSVEVNDENKEALRPGVGLCANCRSMRLIESDRGSTFYLCELSVADPTFPKYPRLPVLQCSGYEPLRGDAPLSRAQE